MLLRKRLASLALVVVASLGLAACTPKANNEVGAVVEMPDTAAGAQAEWLLDVINADSAVSEKQITDRFSPDFIAQVPASEIIKITESVREAKPWTPTKVDGDESNLVMVVESPSADAMQVQMVVNETIITGLMFGPVPAEREPATSWSELEELADILPGDVSVAVTNVADGESVFGVDRDETMPLGSIFKLWVLTAVADEIAAGRLAWDDTLTLTDDVRSLPSGTLQDLETGYEATVLEASELMISISDNTATDMLMAAVGPDALAAAFSSQSDPDLNVPTLTTRGLFQLGWGLGAPARSEWYSADAAERATILADLPTGVLENIAPTDPVWKYGLDWFATADDIVAVHEGLQQRAATDAGAPLRDILSRNPGLEFGPEWSYVAFKGGSSQGVLAGSWLLENEAGDAYVISVQAAGEDPAPYADVLQYLGLATDAAAILAAE